MNKETVTALKKLVRFLDKEAAKNDKNIDVLCTKADSRSNMYLYEATGKVMAYLHTKEEVLKLIKTFDKETYVEF